MSRKKMEKLSGNAYESLPTQVFHMISANPTKKFTIFISVIQLNYREVKYLSKFTKPKLYSECESF